MSVTTRTHSVFCFAFCLALGACGGGGSSDGEGGPGAESPEPVAQEGAPTVTVDSTLRHVRLSWNVQEGDDYYVVSENPDGVSGFTEIATIEEGTEYSFDVSAHLHDWNNAAYIVEACDVNNECVPSLEVSTLDAMLTAIGYFKASNPDLEDEFGQAVAISDDGRTIAVGAHNEGSGIGGETPDQADNSVVSAGAVYIFTLTESGWEQSAYIKASDIASDDDFGHSVALNGNGDTLAVGGAWEENRLLGDQHDTGAVYVFARDDAGNWTEQGYLHASTLTTKMHFGVSVSLSDDGNLLAVGAPGEGGVATEGVEGGGSTSVSGAAYIFTRTDGVWAETAAIASSNLEANDLFGFDLAISGDGTTLAVGALQESSAATGVNGDQADNSAPYAGAVYVFAPGESGWVQQAYLKASNAQANAHFGFALTISDDGNVLAVGAKDDSEEAGAVHMYARTAGVWAHQAHLTSSNTQAGDRFGVDLALSDDGKVLAVGASWEDSTAVGAGGNENINTAPNSGAVYMFAQDASGWAQTAYVKANNTQDQSHFGHSVALDATGDMLAVGATWENGSSSGVSGDQSAQAAENSGAVYIY